MIKISNIQLFQGDCFDIMTYIPSNHINLTVTSPPYDNLRTYNGNISQWSFQKFQAIARELYRITVDGGVIVWIVNDATINGSETGTSFKQALYFKECGCNLHDTMIWEKPTFTDTGSLKVRYAGVFEYMFVFCKGKIKTFNPIKDRPNKSYGRVKHGTIRQKDGNIKPQSSLGKAISEYGQRFNVWHISTEQSNTKRCHPAQFPEQLVKDHIISWSNENDIIFDPFMGSGTTGVVALDTNRKFIGVEIDETYFKIAENRINKHRTEMEL